MLNPNLPLRLRRRALALLARTTPMPRGMRITGMVLNGIACEQVCDASAEEGHALLFLHGGAYCMGSAATHRNLVAHLARRSGVPVYAVDYRLAPEHPAPAAVEDAVSAYRGLLALGIAPERLALAGDSAGGGLALALLLELRRLGLPLPASLVMMSPWVDLSLRGPSVSRNARIDPMLRGPWLAQAAAQYCGAYPAANPIVSPLFGDLSRLPPMLIQVGSDEILLDDAQRLAERVRSAGGAARLHMFPGMWHDFQLHAGLLGESDKAIAEIAAFVRGHWAAAAEA